MLLSLRLTATVRSSFSKSFKPYAQAKRTIFSMTPLPYEIEDGVLPLISAKSLNFHFNEICRGYCETANKLVQGTHLDMMDQTAILERSKVDAGDSLLYHCSIVPGGTRMSIPIQQLIVRNFGSVDELKRRFIRHANATFSNGWTFLVIRDGRLEIVNCKDGATPYGETGVRPIACLDLWEHAYIPDFSHRRADYIERYWEVFDWKAFEERINEKLPEIW